MFKSDVKPQQTKISRDQTQEQGIVSQFRISIWYYLAFDADKAF